MQAQIAQLVQLQALELERARLNGLVAALPTEVKKAQADLAAAQKLEAAAQAALATEEELRAKLEVEIARHRKKAAHVRSQLDAVTTQAQAQAIEHEIQFSETEADRLEADAFASLERSELQEAAQSAAQKKIEDFTEALGKIRARAEARSVEYKAELASLATEREALRPLIDADMLSQFDRIAAKHGTGLARADKQQCTSCRMGIRPQSWNNLREGQLLNCDSCGRLLYWDPAVFAGIEKVEK